MNEKFFHSVRLSSELCKGCINCIKRCPTEAIRVRDGKASIISEFCIDCGECVRLCPYHAKQTKVDKRIGLSKYKYTVALPTPSFYAQFNNLYNINILLTALKLMGFDDVFEVSAAAEMINEAAKEYIASHQEDWPIISTSCPSIVRLIRVRFPNLINHMLPLNPPEEVAAQLARARAMEKTGLSAEEIGIVCISPCPAKVTYARSPLGKDKSEIDEVFAAKDVYKLVLPYMKEAEKNPEPLATSGKVGVSWGAVGGEASSICSDNSLAADGIENVINILEDLEDEKFTELQYIELKNCSGGCVGGVLNVENPYAAKAKLQKMCKNILKTKVSVNKETVERLLNWNMEVPYEPVFQIGSNMIEAMQKMRQIDQLCKGFPSLDCGSCGAPTCRALAEDIVRGHAEMNDCEHVLRNHIHVISQTYKALAEEAMKNEDQSKAIYMLNTCVKRITEEIELLDSGKITDPAGKQ